MFNRSFDDARVQDITDLADVGKGTFFNFFSAKELVIPEIARERVRLLRRSVDQVKAGQVSCREVLNHYMSTASSEGSRRPTGTTTSVPIEEGGGGGEDQTAAAAAAERLKGTFNYVYEVGQNAQYIPKDVGVALKAGGKIYFNSTHLHSIGKEIRFQTRVGFKLHPRGDQPRYPQGTSGRPASGNGLGAELDIPSTTTQQNP